MAEILDSVQNDLGGDVPTANDAMSSTATATATQQALDVVEILEIILVKLPMTKIYTIQRVSKRWQAVIAESTEIQQLMFRATKGPPVNPTEVKACRELFFPTGSFATQVIYGEELQFNPAIQGTTVVTPRDPGQASPVQHWIRTNRGLSPASLLDAKWLEGMFMTNPPCTTAEIQVVGHGRCDHPSSCSIRDEDGLRYGLLYEVAEKLCQSGCNRKMEILTSIRIMIYMTVSDARRDTHAEDTRRNLDMVVRILETDRVRKSEEVNHG